MSENGTKVQLLKHLKVEFAVKQKTGLPFIMASADLWAIMLIAFLTDLNVATKNMIAMCCSALLMPVGMLFGKILKVNIFSKDNPLNSLSIVAALNQLMYLPIVLWAMYAAPNNVIMVYAIVVGAHFLPYYWIYFSYSRSDNNSNYVCSKCQHIILSTIFNLVRDSNRFINWLH